jgi:hypothetical protein
MKRFAVGEGGAEVVLLGVVQGLVAEAERVRAAFVEARPAAVALGVSPEAVAGLSRYQSPEDPGEHFDDLPDAEFAYASRLNEYSEVALPPPDLREAVRLAREAGVPVFGVDLTEEQYEDVFTREVGALALLRYGRIQRQLARKPPRASDARAFALAWDAEVRRVKGIARVEERREFRIAEGARALARQVAGLVLLVVDAPREAGVEAALSLAASGRPSA